MAVIVQRLLNPQAAGVLFTADPVTSNRTVACVEAVFGLGEALVSGRVEADAYRVRHGTVISASTGSKPFAVLPASGGGTAEVPIPRRRRRQPVLSDAQVVWLVELGRRIEARLGRPQDIEWCLVDGSFHIVQSRPITTLFPVPAATDAEYHVYVSVGHAQMMTDAMRPLGISVWQHTALIPMHDAGGRLFVDVTQRLASPATRALTLDVFGRGDPLMRDALETVLSRDDVLPVLRADTPPAPAAGSAPTEIQTDPAIVAELVERRPDALSADGADEHPFSPGIAIQLAAALVLGALPRAGSEQAFPLQPLEQPGHHTLKRKCMQSPSWTTYSLPSTRKSPFSRTAASEPNFIRSW
jgi:pyruvate,water dikinase